jgi:hypothetical protein
MHLDMELLQPSMESFLEGVLYLALGLSALCGLSLLILIVVDSRRLATLVRKRKSRRLARELGQQKPSRSVEPRER